MALALGAVATQVSAYFAGLTISSVISSALVSIAGNFVLSAVSRSLAKKPKNEFALAGQQRTQVVRQPITYHRVIYGKVRVGGAMTFLHSHDNDSKLDECITIASHPIQSVENIYFFDEELTLDGSGNVSSPSRWFGHAAMKFGLGTTATDSDMLAFASGRVPDKWTADHKQEGRAKAWIAFNYQSGIFSGGIPTPTFVVKGHNQIYDPRDLSTGWSDNPALCIRHFLLDTGLAASADEIPDDEVIAAANTCDESVSLAGGGSESRYTLNGHYDRDRDPMEVLPELLSAMAGKIVRSGGKWYIYAGAYRTPTIELDEDDLDGNIKTTVNVSRRELYNAVKGVYVSPDQFYQPTDFPPVTNATYLSEDNNERLWKDIELKFTTSASMSQRLAKIDLEQARLQLTTVWPCNLSALRLAAASTVLLTNTRKGWNQKPFEIMDFKLVLRGRGENARIGVDLFMRETASSVYDWNSGEETTIDAAPNTDLPDPYTVLQPGAPAISEVKYSTRTGGGLKVKAVASWEASSSAFVERYQLRYKLSTDTTWIELPRTASTAQDVLDIAPGVYDFSVKAINQIGVESEYSYTYNQEIFGLADTPADVTGLTLQAISSVALLNFDQHPDLDVLEGGKIHVRHSEATSGATWEDSYTITDAVAGTATFAPAPLKAGTYLVKAQDSTGQFSANAVTISTKNASVQTFSTLNTITENSLFNGTHVNTFVDGGILKLGGSGNFDDIPDLDAVEDLDYYGGVASEGTYTFASGVDRGAVEKLRVETNITMATSNVLDAIDARTGNIDTWLDFDGSAGGGSVDVRVEARETDDDPSGSPTWSEWKRVDAADYDSRGLQFRAILTSDDPAYTVSVSALGATVKELA